jgi:uncharacterized protein YfiM (DUF2279 family)
MIGALQLAVALNVIAPAAPAPVRSPLESRLARAAAFDTYRFAQGPARDPWFSQDKSRHAAMSFATAGFTYAGGRTIGLDHDTALPAALGVATLAGIGKEISDRRKGRRASYRDLVWDAVGIGASMLLLRSVR